MILLVLQPKEPTLGIMLLLKCLFMSKIIFFLWSYLKVTVLDVRKSLRLYSNSKSQLSGLFRKPCLFVNLWKYKEIEERILFSYKNKDVFRKYYQKLCFKTIFETHLSGKEYYHPAFNYNYLFIENEKQCLILKHLSSNVCKFLAFG